MTPTFTPPTSKTIDGVTQSGGSPGGLVDDVGGQEREVGPVLMREQPVDAVVELVVAVGRGVQAPRVLDVDGRHVLEQARVRRRGTDVVTAGQQQRRSPSAAISSSNSVARRAAPPTVTLLPSNGIVVGSSWPWKSLSPTIVSGVTPARPSSSSSSTRPWECCGSGMSIR